MKKNTLANGLFLLVVAIAAICFNLDGLPITTPSSDDPLSKEPSRYFLAVSWQPAFCEQRPNKPECRSQRAGRFDTSNFSLHGLWPEPRSQAYCEVPQNLVAKDKSGRWRDLPKLELGQNLRDKLSQKMPGYRSYLHRHEWLKHGTCMGGISAEDYYRISLNLLDQLNASSLRKFFADNIGNRLEFRDVENAFRKAFGKSSGNRMIVDCYRDEGRRIIQELKLSLAGDLTKKPDLSDALADGSKVGRSCPSGIVDPVGLQ